ncbi:hypothetical protein TNCV_2979671 [Trichonephila clavipes]|nr:hypothetical protein TNCV_2979671 [Trichonephila clavipes]
MASLEGHEDPYPRLDNADHEFLTRITQLPRLHAENGGIFSGTRAQTATQQSWSRIRYHHHLTATAFWKRKE